MSDTPRTARRLSVTHLVAVFDIARQWCTRAAARVTAGVMVAGSTLAGCADSVAGPAAARPAQARTAATVLRRERVRVTTIDDRFENLAGRLPGFGGMFRDATGALTVYLTNPGRRELAATVLRQFLTERGGRSAATADRAVGGLRVLQGQYDFRQLRRWYRRIHSGPRIAGITQTDIDERRNRIVLGVRDAAAAERVRAAVAADPQIPAGAVVVEVIAPQVLEQAPTLGSVVRPTVGGLRIERAGSPSGCSLGYNAQRADADGVPDGNTYFITASHCTSVMFSDDADIFGQPDAGSAVGGEVADPPGFDNDWDWFCNPGRTCRYSDAALIRYTYLPFTDVQFAVARVGGGAPFDLVGSGDVLDDTRAGEGQQVFKIGQTTGLTTGTVQNTCVDVDVPDRNGFDSGLTLLCQSQATYDSGPGDSGAPVYAEGPNGEVTAVGIHNSASGTSGLRTFSNLSYARQELQGWLGGTLKVTAGPF